MAAVLCRAFTYLSDNVCLHLLHPFKRCGEVLCSPFFPYLGVTVILNTPPAVWIWQAREVGWKCELYWWLWIDGPTSAMHILGAFYVVYKVLDQIKVQENAHNLLADLHEQPPKLPPVPASTRPRAPDFGQIEAPPPGGSPAKSEDPVNTTLDYQNMDAHPPIPLWVAVSPSHESRQTFPENHGADGNLTAFSESVVPMYFSLQHVLCDDPGVAIYLLVALFWVTWQVIGMGIIFSSDGKDDEEDYRYNDDDDYSCSLRTQVFWSCTLGWLYALLAFVTFASSFASSVRATQ
jgi:hypothetical protein